MTPKHQIPKAMLQYGLEVRKGTCGAYIQQQKLLRQMKSLLAKEDRSLPPYDRLYSRQVRHTAEEIPYFEEMVLRLDADQIEHCSNLLAEKGIKALAEYLLTTHILR
jgi:hypothetical protein